MAIGLWHERWGERWGERLGERWSAKVVPAQVPPPHHHINANAATAIPAGRRRRMSAPVMCSAPVTISITSEATAPPPHGPSALLSHGAVVPFPSTFPSPRLVERPRTATATSPSYNSPYSYSPSRSRTDGRDAPPTLRGVALTATAAMAAAPYSSCTFSSSSTSPSLGDLISPPPRCISWAEISELRYLGEGEFCTVWGATLDGSEVAVKVLKEEQNTNQLALDDLQRETQIMMGLSHPGILRVRGVGETEGKPFLVLDRLKATLIASLPRPPETIPFWERRAAARRWPLSRALQCGLELAEALRHCHDDALPGFRLMHRDVKPDNIGFLDDGRLVLFDFGLAKLWQTSCDEPADAPRQLTGQTGSARYMAPEVARSRPYGTSAEVYSFGILLWQLASHERPFAGMDMQRHARQVVDGGQRPPLKKGCATAAVRAARGLLARAARAPPWHAGGVRPPAQAA